MTEHSQERRQYLRIETPLSVRIITKDNVVEQTQTKDISPIGIRCSIKQDSIKINDETELKISIPDGLSAIHAKAKVVWKKKVSAESGMPYDIGCEFTRIEEDNKNTFLKYFCDLLYKQKDSNTR